MKFIKFIFGYLLIFGISIFAEDTYKEKKISSCKKLILSDFDQVGEGKGEDGDCRLLLFERELFKSGFS